MRTWRELRAGPLAIAAIATWPPHAHGVAPAAKPQAPGWHRVTRGDLAVMALADDAVAALPLRGPAVTFRLGNEPGEATIRRKRAFANGTAGRHGLAAPRLPHSGIGHMRADGRGYGCVDVAADDGGPR
ncbi:MAG: hypothetical protein IPM22_11725 [Betaproteobacteria bacterium]|nr:hypothetical protein [Betaproteobacteria bacterium]